MHRHLLLRLQHLWLELQIRYLRRLRSEMHRLPHHPSQWQLRHRLLWLLLTLTVWYLLRHPHLRQYLRRRLP